MKYNAFENNRIYCKERRCSTIKHQVLILQEIDNKKFFFNNPTSRCLSEMESRTQGSRLRTQKKSEAKAMDSPSKDRHSRGQGQECSRPRTKDTNASVLQKKFFKNFSQAISKKKNRLQKNFFRRSPKKRSRKKFSPIFKILTIQKIVLSSSRGQAIFEGLRLRGQGLQNVSSRTPPLLLSLISTRNFAKSSFSDITKIRIARLAVECWFSNGIKSIFPRFRAPLYYFQKCSFLQ